MTVNEFIMNLDSSNGTRPDCIPGLGGSKKL